LEDINGAIFVSAVRGSDSVTSLPTKSYLLAVSYSNIMLDFSSVDVSALKAVENQYAFILGFFFEFSFDIALFIP
jgi:hypothetical protein